MGKIALSLAKNVYITDDNPRYEDPENIRSEIFKIASFEEIKLFCSSLKIDLNNGLVKKKVLSEFNCFAFLHSIV